MAEFFQAGIGLDSDMMNQMEAIMNMYQSNGQFASNQSPQMHIHPAQIPAKFAKEARFQPGYDSDEDEVEIRKMIKQKISQCQHSYDEFEEKLSHGIVDAPNLNLYQVPPSIFDNEPPIKMIYLRDNYICELPEFFFDELPNLTWLDLRGNKLSNLPSLNGRHNSLRVMLLQGNRIRALPYTLALAVNLRTIALTGCGVANPSEDIQKQGCKKILEYLHEQMLKRVPIDETGDYAEIPSQHNSQKTEDDEKLLQDLKKTAMKCVTKSSKQNFKRQPSELSAGSGSKTEEQRRAERLIYTWELWKKIPYDGVTKSELFEKSLEEVKSQVLTKLNAQQEALLQKCKNQEVLKKWRSETKLMQLNNSKPNLKINPTESAPFGNELNKIIPTCSRILRPLEFKTELEDCWRKLREFKENPAPLSDTELALKRLRDVENIHRRLLDVKLSVKPTI